MFNLSKFTEKYNFISLQTWLARWSYKYRHCVTMPSMFLFEVGHKRCFGARSGRQGKSKGAFILFCILRKLGQVLLCLTHIVTLSLAHLVSATQQLNLQLIPVSLDPPWAEKDTDSSQFWWVPEVSSLLECLPCRLQAPTSDTKPYRDCWTSSHNYIWSKPHNIHWLHM